MDNHAPGISFWGGQSWILLFTSFIGCLAQWINWRKRTKEK